MVELMATGRFAWEKRNVGSVMLLVMRGWVLVQFLSPFQFLTC